MTRPMPTRPARRRGQPRAFTLLEVLIVVGIIALLTSLLVISITHLSTNAKKQQTRATMAQCVALYNGWQAVAHQPFAAGTMPAPQNVTADFAPIGVSKVTVDETMAGAPDRFGAAVWFTRDLLFNIRSVPANGAALSKLAPSQLMTFPPTYNVAFPNPYGTAQYTNTVTYTPFTPSAAANVQFERVWTDDGYGNYTYYDCLQYVYGTTAAPAPASTAPPNKSNWLTAYPAMSNKGTTPTDDGVPVLLDAWGNPIIFVPGNTLGADPSTYTLNADGTVPPGSGGMVSGTGSAAIKTQAKSPDGRPFFASAGPGGNFANGDDNLYSFER